MTQKQNYTRPDISIVKGSDLRVRVKHREYIADVVGSSSSNGAPYNVTQYAINPGLISQFPWLANMANLFESYKFNSLCFEFRTSSSTATVGKIILSIDWDAADAAPGSKQAQLQERTVADDAVWENFNLVCDQQDLLKFGVQRYMRSGALPSNLDIKTYDIGNLWVATQGLSTASLTIGELYVCYDVELITPQQAQINTLFQDIAGVSPTTTSLLGTQTQTANSANIASVAGEVVTFNQAGNYLMTYEANASTSITFTANPVGSLGAVIAANDVGGTGTIAYLQNVLVSTPVGGKVTYDNTIVSTAGNTCYLSIVAVSSAYLID